MLPPEIGHDWAPEEAKFARKMTEQTLTHIIQNAIERAHRRPDLFEKRRVLMKAWAHCSARRT